MLSAFHLYREKRLRRGITILPAELEILINFDTQNSQKAKGGLRRLLMSPETTLSITVILAFVLVASAAISSYMYSSRAIKTGESVEKSQEMLGGLESILSIMTDMKSQVETFIKTSDQGAKSRYANDKVTLAKYIKFVRHTGDEEGWRRWHFTYLEQLVERFGNNLDIALKEKTRGNTTSSEANVDKAEQLLEVVRGRLIISAVDERAVLKERLSDYRQHAEQTSLMFLSLGSFILLFVIPLTVIVRRYIRATRNAFLVEQQVSREIVKHAPIGILQLTDKFVIKDINPIFESFLSASPNVVGLSIWDLLPELPRDQLTQTVNSGTPAIMNGVLITQIGSQRDLESYWDIAAWPVLEEGRARSLIMLIEDISDKTILSKQKEVLQQTIAHDLKSPLIASNYLIQAMLKRFSTAKNGDQELLLRLQDSNADALNMVKNMLEISKYRQGMHLLTLTPVDLDKLIKTLVSNLDFRCQMSEVSIKIIAPKEPTILESDTAALKHLIGNLLENAVKFSPAQGCVTLTVENRQQQIAIHVHNSGPVIHEKDKEQIFTPFWQGALGQQSAGGTGIGLYLCQQIAHSLNGEISFTSDESSGTTFSVTLPCKLNSEAVA